jgi:hypothetical protein
MRKKSRLAKRKQPPKKRPPFLLLVMVFILVVVGLIWFLSKGGVWIKGTNLSLVLRQEEGAQIVVVNPTTQTLTTIFIPGETEITAARNLGEWKVASLWRLGEDEGIGGELLARSINKTFHLPIVAWGEGVSQKPLLIKATNLSVIDKLKLTLFGLGVKNAKKQEIDLTQTSVLVRSKLANGEEGYKVSGHEPAWLAAVFGESLVSAEGQGVIIVDAGAGKSLTDEVGKIIGVVGAKVVAVETTDEADFGCVVGRGSTTSLKIAAVFGCRLENSQLEPGLVEVKLGKSFRNLF